MLLFAVTALEKLQTLPPAIWLKIAIAIGAFILTIFLFRRVMKMNKISDPNKIRIGQKIKIPKA